MTTLMPTVADYQKAFDAERLNVYPVVDAFEQRMGFALDRAKLEAAARVLACPLKKSPPNWQHGRVLYAAIRKYLATTTPNVGVMLDVGTAKGFSALCAEWAGRDAGVSCVVYSVDVIDPESRVRRNTVSEVDGLKTLAEILAPWPEAGEIGFSRATGVEWLNDNRLRVNVAFIDGKHTGAVVAQEGRLLAKWQQAGDIAIFDDVHLDDVNKAVVSLSDLYELETLRILPNRAYAIGVRRG
jgi:hypothetical protein